MTEQAEAKAPTNVIDALLTSWCQDEEIPEQTLVYQLLTAERSKLLDFLNVCQDSWSRFKDWPDKNSDDEAEADRLLSRLDECSQHELVYLILLQENYSGHVCDKYPQGVWSILHPLLTPEEFAKLSDEEQIRIMDEEMW